MANVLSTLADRLLVCAGLRPAPISSLTVTGRKTGSPRTVQVRVIEHGGERWLVAPYGVVNWVRNIRATGGRAVLTNGRKTTTIQVEEVSAETAAPILKQYLGIVAVVRPHFKVTPDAPLAEFVTEAPRHPVFRIIHCD